MQNFVARENLFRLFFKFALVIYGPVADFIQLLTYKVALPRRLGIEEVLLGIKTKESTLKYNNSVIKL